MCRRATVVSHPPSLLSSGNLSMLWTRMVKVSCVMSAASSVESPYRLGTEKTMRSYFSSKRRHAPTLPLRQARIRSRSGVPAPSRFDRKLVTGSQRVATLYAPERDPKVDIRFRRSTQRLRNEHRSRNSYYTLLRAGSKEAGGIIDWL